MTTLVNELVLVFLMVLGGVLTVNSVIERYSNPSATGTGQDSESTSTKKLLPGPNGELCILDDKDLYDPYYEHWDENGRCCCSMCLPGHYVQSLCQCRAGTDETPARLTECVHVERGQFMDKENKCSQPYTCAASCNENQTQVSECTAWADLVCRCKDGWFNPDPWDTGTVPKECLPKPPCPAGEEPQIIGGSTDFTCRPCRKGFFKVTNDAKSCQRHKACVAEPGSAVADNDCRDDDASLTARSETEGEHLQDATLLTPSLHSQTKDSAEAPTDDVGSPSTQSGEQLPSDRSTGRQTKEPTQPVSSGPACVEYWMCPDGYVTSIIFIACLGIVMFEVVRLIKSGKCMRKKKVEPQQQNEELSPLEET